jgi:hypothetical protein
MTEPLSTKAGLDVADFVAGVRTINTSMRVLDSDFKKNAAALGDWSKSATGMEERIRFLNNAIDLQKQKLEKTQAAYEAQVKLTGENSKAAQEWQIKVNKATEQLNKMEYELGENEEALKEMTDESQKSAKAVDNLGEKSKGTGNLVGALKGAVLGVIGVIAALAAGVAIAATALGGLMFSTADASAELVDLAAKTGISTTRLQELAYVGDQVGTSSDTITSSLARMIRTVGDAAEQQEDYKQKMAEAQAAGKEFTGELGPAATAFDRLGISLTDSNGQLRDAEAIFSDAIAALGGIQNATERDSLAMDIFGRSAMELNPLIKAGSDELARLSEEAHKVGAVMSEEDVAAFEAFDDTLASLQAGLKGTVGTLAASFLPGFQSVFDRVGGYVQSFSEIVRGSNGDMGQIAQGLTGLISQIIGDVTQQGPQMLQTGLGILQSIVDAIITNLPTMIPAAIEMIQTLLTFIIANLPVLIDAGLQILIALVNGISTSLPTLIPAIVLALITIVQTLTENLPMLIDAALQLILALAQGLIIALPVLIAALPQIIGAILQALVDALPMIFEAAGQLIGMLSTGLVAAIPVLVVAIGELIAQASTVGMNFLDGIPVSGMCGVRGRADGISSASGWLYDSVTNLINGMIARIKDLLGMHSPAKVGIDIGGNTIKSIGQGGEAEAESMQRRIGKVINGMVRVMSAPVSTATPGFAFAGAGAAGGGSISIGDIYVDARGATDPAAVGAAVGDGLVKRLRARGAL